MEGTERNYKSGFICTQECFLSNNRQKINDEETIQVEKGLLHPRIVITLGSNQSTRKIKEKVNHVGVDFTELTGSHD